MALIYLITNTVNGKQYVGKTTRSLDVRWQGHLGSARRGDSDMLVCRAIKKHGASVFELSILKEIDGSELPVSDRELGEWEKHFIKELKTHVSQGGYNLTFGGDGGLPGYRFSDESREKIRQKALGRKHTPETLAKISAKKRGVKQSEESVAKRVAANTGKKRTEEQKARMKAGQLASGYQHSDETKAKISEARLGRATSEQTKEKLREACLGWHQSDEVKKRISQARSRPVRQFSKDGNLIGEFPSVKAAAQLSGASTTSISRSLASGKCVAGFLWQYQNVQNGA